MKVRTGAVLFFVALSVGAPLLPAFSGEMSDDQKVRLCKMASTKIAATIVELRARKMLDKVKEAFDEDESFRSSDVMELLINRMLYVADAAPSLTVGELSANGHAYCLAIID